MSSPNPAKVRTEGSRPLEVTIVAILVWAEGVLYVIAGMILLMNLKNADLAARAGGMELMVPLALTAFVIALTFLGASGGLLRGNTWTRLLITVLMSISIVFAIYVISGGERVLGGALIALFALGAIVLLWTPRASAYFKLR